MASDPDSAAEAQLNRREALGSVTAAALVVGLGVGTAHAAETVTVAAYLVQRLRTLGVDVLFGVPGATCDPFYTAAAESLEIVVTASDLEAGYAVDGYARFNGLGAVAVTRASRGRHGRAGARVRPRP